MPSTGRLLSTRTAWPPVRGGVAACGGGLAADAWAAAVDSGGCAGRVCAPMQANRFFQLMHNLFYLYVVRQVCSGATPISLNTQIHMIRSHGHIEQRVTTLACCCTPSLTLLRTSAAAVGTMAAVLGCAAPALSTRTAL